MLLIGVAGALGALARYGTHQLCTWALRGYTPEGWVWSTLLANTLGCFLFGIVWALTEGRWSGAVEIRHVVLVGFLGSFTTFSTFAFELVGFGQNQRYLMLCLHLSAHLSLGVAGVVLGLWLGHRLVGT